MRFQQKAMFRITLSSATWLDDREFDIDSIREGEELMRTIDADEAIVRDRQGGRVVARLTLERTGATA